MNTLESRVKKIVATTLNVPLERVTADTQMGSVPEWESMAHLMLVLSLEQEFGRQFSPAEIEGMKSVREIVARLETTGNEANGLKG